MSTPHLADLTAGDQVVLKRNLNHPAWMKQVPADPRSGRDTQYVPDPEIEELLCAKTQILERRDIPAVLAVFNWSGRAASSLVRLSNGYWYDLLDGLQHDCGATRIEVLA